MTNWIARNKGTIIRFAFLVPIILVAIISISHVISWYTLANPLSWAIYLSIAIEIAAMSSIAAASVKVKGFSVWLVFIIVTIIQFIGNIYFCYAEIDINSEGFKQWVELTKPIFEIMGSGSNDILSQKRWLALLEGGLLPLISLTCLHFFIQYEDRKEPIDKTIEESIKEELVKIVEEIVEESPLKEEAVPEIVEESNIEEEAVPKIVEEAPILDIIIEEPQEEIIIAEEKVEEEPAEKKTN